MRQIIHALLILLFFVSSAFADTIDPSIAWQKVKSGALLVDVRSVDEFNQGHLSNALNIPHTEVAPQLSKFGNNKDREIVLYCRSGRRADIAKSALEANGFTKVFNAGAYTDLAKLPQ
jgi:phage shock protein E